MAYLLSEPIGKEESDVWQVEGEEDYQGPYEEIEKLMEPKMAPQQKQDIVEKMLSLDLVPQEKVEYLNMLSRFPNLFITSYEEIRGFHGEDLHIELKDGAQPVRQKLRKMGKEQMAALREEEDKLLKAGFIEQVDTCEWVSPTVVTPKKDG